MKKLIIANWKMTPNKVEEAGCLFGDIQKSSPKLKNTEVVICPPFVYLGTLSNVKGQRLGVKLGAQDVFWENPTTGGSYTGEISIAMLKNLGVKYVIVGHSERREYFQTNNEIINKKTKVALKNNLKVIFCVGEKERDEEGDYLKFIKKEIIEGLHKVPKKDLKNLIIVYEPIWAISAHKGTQADTPENFLQTSIYIRRVLFFKFGIKVSRQTAILYGGSVDAKNARGFLEEGKAQGLLIGRASWKAKSFVEILSMLRNTK